MLKTDNVEPGVASMIRDIAISASMTVACGMIDGLPVGLMLSGRHCDEATIYKAACAFEQAGDWKAM